MKFKFTFKTDEELAKAEATGFIESYDMVRVELKYNNGSSDFPCKTEEEYKKCIDTNFHSLVRVYQSTHSFDIMDYD